MRDQIFQTSRETLVLCYSIPLYSFEIFSFLINGKDQSGSGGLDHD